MADRIYTQADYDKVTDLYNNYQNSKDRYTPEQQQKIESAFNNAWTSVSNGIEASKNRISDMYLDSNGNTVQVYGDGRSEIVQYAPVKNTNRQRVSATPKGNSNPNPNPNPNPNNQNSDLIYMGNDDAGNPIYINRQNASNYLGWDFDKYGLVGPDNDQATPQNVPNPTNTNNNRNSNNNRSSNNNTYNPGPVTNFVNNIRSIPTRVEGTIDTLKSTPQFLNDVSNTVKSYNQMTDWNGIQGIRDNIQGAVDFAGSLPGTLKSTNNMLEGVNKITNNKLTTDAVRRLLSRGYRMGSDGTIYYPDGRVFTKL